MKETTLIAKTIEIETSKFIQIPGPNPILVTGGKDSWDEKWIECCDIFKDYNTYYLYYHGMPLNDKLWPVQGYRIGVATASHPLGPWKKYEKNPIVDLGAKGDWDDHSVACAFIIKEGVDKYYMWYSGFQKCEGFDVHCDIGLATASSPLGPWKKYKGNPILKDFGYVGSVIKVKNKYYMYNEYPISLTGPDYGPIALATASSPEGPWTKYKSNPVLSPGDWGSWDDGGFSEAEVVYRDGVFHMFYGGAKSHPVRIRTMESIGYAYSFDGYNFTKYNGNPVALREKNPDASAFAEVHSFFEYPFTYLYHTLRYNSRENDEDIGVQVLATARPFRLVMPVLNIDYLQAGLTTSLNDCPPISLEHVSTFAITVDCTYHVQAKAGLRIHVRASYDGIGYDTEDLYSFDISFRPGETVSKTIELDAKVMFIKVLVENLDKMQNVSNVKVTATLGD